MGLETEPRRSLFAALKRLLLGAPIATSRAHHERLPILFALPLFASDNISSVAYATEEILRMLALAGTAYLNYVIWISLAIVALVVVVVFSYTRTVHAYPEGGGDYRVASDNLGSGFGRVAGAALLIDYTLTVAVSVSSGVLAIVSAFPATQPYIIHMNLAAIATVAYVNLRGMRESGTVFAIPTYSFVLFMFGLVITGLIGVGTIEAEHRITMAHVAEPFTYWLVLRAFAAGCAALTGIEAIAGGTPAFKAPEAVNASKTLMYLGGILVIVFLGVSWLSAHYPITIMDTRSPGYKTVVAQLAANIFGEGAAFYGLQIATMAILILAANTAFADFPRLASFIAKDSFLPRQLANLGDKLVFQNGILLLAVVAMLLVWFSGGDTHRLIPLYALGVFTAFTLGQAGMVVRQRRTGAPWWGTVLSAIGAAATGVVWVIILITKFHDGAWLVVLAITALLLLFLGIRRHYDYLARTLNPAADEKLPEITTTVLMLVPPRIHRGILKAISYAKQISDDFRAVHITDNPATIETIKKEWDKFGGNTPLVILESPYRSLVEPLVEYIDEAVRERENHVITIVLPQAVPKKWWQSILHNNSALPIKMALAPRKNVVVINVRYFLE